MPKLKSKQGFWVFQVWVIGYVGNAIKLKRIIEVVGEKENTKHGDEQAVPQMAERGSRTF